MNNFLQKVLNSLIWIEKWVCHINKNAGKQLDSKYLYKQQKKAIEKGDIIDGPVIIATDLYSPENIGGLIRIADAAGCKKVILINEEKIIFSKKMQNIARNAEKNIEIIQCSFNDFIKIKEGFNKLIAIELTDSSNEIFNVSLPNVCSFVIGNERHGISKNVLELCHQAVHIPMYGVNGSMNVIQALAISLFEWRRQQDKNL